MPRWIQDRNTGELIPVQKRRPRAPVTAAVHADIEPFTSPIDKSVIGSRAQLRRHNEEHDVAQHREYGEGDGQAYIRRKHDERITRGQGQTAQDRRDRLNIIAAAVDKHTR